MIGDDDAPLSGYCDSRSGKSGCNGLRKLTAFKSKAGTIYRLCDLCYPHRVRIAKQKDSERKRNA